MVLSGRDVQLYMEAGKLQISPVAAHQFQQNGVDLILKAFEHQRYWPGTNREMFSLGVTNETLHLPNDLMAFVELRSSWARRGFLLPPTIVDAGFVGELTLEIMNFGMDPLASAVGERFAHLIFAKTSGPCVEYAGKYQNQTGITGARPDIG